MAKKHRRNEFAVTGERKESIAQPAATETLSPRGKKVIRGGICLLISGFALLTQTDPMGLNWASQLAPILILAAYALIGLGTFLPDSE